MFFKEWRKLTEARVTGMENRVSKLESIPLIDSIDCDTCGCMVRKSLAVKGKSRIVSDARGGVILTQTPKENPLYNWFSAAIPVERIETPYYCKRCAPKKRK